MPKHKKFSEKHAPQVWWGIFFPSTLPLGVLTGVAIIAVAAFIAYFPSLNGGFIWDDEFLLTKNTVIKASDGLYRIWCTSEEQDYWPVTNTTFWLEWRLWGMRSTGYHATNLVLHIAASLLIWTILRKLSIPGAFLAAVIFAVHPVNVESVAWISQRKNLLAMLFFLLSIMCYLQMETQPLPEKSPYRPSVDFWYWFSLTAFVLAMLSKGSVAVLPVVLLGIIWWRRGVTKEDLIRTTPYFVAAVGFTGLNVWFQTHDLETVIRSAGFTERVLGAGGVVWFYLYKSLFPFDLVFIYPQWHVDAGNPLWWLPLSAVLIITVVLWRYRESWSRPLLFTWGFFCVALAPVMGFIDVGFMQYSLVADHYQHIAIIGVIALVAAFWGLWRQRLCGAARWAAITIVVVMAGGLTFLTWQQSGLYANAVTLYRATLEKNPECWLAYNNLGVIFAETGRTREAIEHYEQSLRFNPNYYAAHNNLANILSKTGHIQEAIEHYRQALRFNPYFFESHYNLGVVMAQTGQTREAIDHYRKALQLKPGFVDAHINLGLILVNAGQPREAIEHYLQALRIKPDLPEAHNNLGNAFVQTGRMDEAIEEYRQALRIKSDFPEAHNNLGITLARTGRLPEAIDHFEQTLRLKPDYSEAHNNLGNTLVQAGRPREAITHFMQAFELQSDYIDAYFNLALTYAITNQPDEAATMARKALEIAKSKGQTLEAKRIEDWLNSYGASLSELPNIPPPSRFTPPSP